MTRIPVSFTLQLEGEEHVIDLQSSKTKEEQLSMRKIRFLST